MFPKASIAVLLVSSLVSPGGSALEGTLHSAATMGERGLVIGADVGFPYLTVGAAYGLTPSVDLATRLRSGWGRTQRAGLGARWTFRNSDTAAAVRFDLDALLASEPSGRWNPFSGRYDVGFGGSFLYSWNARSDVVLTCEAGLEVVGYHDALQSPLGGKRPPLTFGPNMAFRFGAEWPLVDGLWLSLDAGARLHLTGFDHRAALPTLSAGLAYAFP